jgi:hypothetical protein
VGSNDLIAMGIYNLALALVQEYSQKQNKIDR